MRAGVEVVDGMVRYFGSDTYLDGADDFLEVWESVHTVHIKNIHDNELDWQTSWHILPTSSFTNLVLF